MCAKPSPTPSTVTCWLKCTAPLRLAWRASAPTIRRGFADKYADPDIIAEWYNPDLAKEYLAKAGYAEGEGPTLYLDTPAVGRGGGAKEVAEVAAALLEDVGFTVDLTVRDASAFAVEVQRSGNNRDLMLATLGCGSRLACRSSTNATGMRSPTASATRNGMRSPMPSR